MYKRVWRRVFEVAKHAKKMCRALLQLVIKPATNGSIIGVFIIFDDNDWEKFRSTVWIIGNKITIEKYIPCRAFLMER